MNPHTESHRKSHKIGGESHRKKGESHTYGVSRTESHTSRTKKKRSSVSMLTLFLDCLVRLCDSAQGGSHMRTGASVRPRTRGKYSRVRCAHTGDYPP